MSRRDGGNCRRNLVEGFNAVSVSEALVKHSSSEKKIECNSSEGQMGCSSSEEKMKCISSEDRTSCTSVGPGCCEGAGRGSVVIESVVRPSRVMRQGSALFSLQTKPSHPNSCSVNSCSSSDLCPANPCNSSTNCPANRSPSCNSSNSFKTLPSMCNSIKSCSCSTYCSIKTSSSCSSCNSIKTSFSSLCNISKTPSFYCGSSKTPPPSYRHSQCPPCIVPTPGPRSLPASPTFSRRQVTDLTKTGSTDLEESRGGGALSFPPDKSSPPPLFSHPLLFETGSGGGSAGEGVPCFTNGGGEMKRRGSCESGFFSCVGEDFCPGESFVLTFN